MAVFAGVLMVQAQDQNPSASNESAPNAQAVPMHRRAPDPEREAQRLGKKLNLSQDQVAQLQPILADRNQQMQSLRGDTSLSQQDRRAKFQSIRQDSNNKIEALLNDQQKQQYEQMMAARQSHRRGAPQEQ